MSNPWEYGSEFDSVPWLFNEGPSERSDPWMEAPERSFGATARDLLALTLAAGVQTHGWETIWLPSYGCESITEGANRVAGLQIQYYPQSPANSQAPQIAHSWTTHDVVLTVDYFGAPTTWPHTHKNRPWWWIGDYTHDPWSRTAHDADADIAVASLRKSVPLPDGAVAWSPAGSSPVPVPQGRLSTSTTEMWHTAMQEKREYLRGQQGPETKDWFSTVFQQRKRDLAAGQSTQMSALASDRLRRFDTQRAALGRRRNFHRLRAGLLDQRSASGHTKVPPSSRGDWTPFCLPLHFATQDDRNQARQELINQRVYPSILWQLPPGRATVDQEAYDFSTRVLCLACDSRYDFSDCDQVTQVVRDIVTRTGIAPPTIPPIMKDAP